MSSTPLTALHRPHPSSAPACLYGVSVGPAWHRHVQQMDWLLLRDRFHTD